MNLTDYQRTVMRVSFDREPSALDLAALGEESRWRTYRHMVRSRLEAMAEVAFKRTRELVGEATFVDGFARFLAESGARSPLIREVTAAFGEFAQADAVLLSSAPAHTRDVLAFELAKWQVAYLAAQLPVLGEAGVRELDFEGKPVLNPVLRQLTLSRAALPCCDLPSAPGDGDTFDMLVYRPPHHEVRWWAVSAFFAGFIARVQQAEHSVADAGRRVAERQHRAIDEALLEELATDLTLAVQRSVLFGVRD